MLGLLLLLNCFSAAKSDAQFEVGPVVGYKTLFSSAEQNNILELPQKTIFSPAFGLNINYAFNERMIVSLMIEYSQYYIQGDPVSMLFEQPSGISFKLIQNQISLQYGLFDKVSFGPVLALNSIFDYHFTRSNLPFSEYIKISKFPSKTRLGAGITCTYSIRDFKIIGYFNKSFNLYGDLFFTNDNNIFLGLGLAYSVVIE